MHMGTGKTGSSALQSSFAQNSNVLAEKGVLYAPHKSQGKAAQGLITSGNAAELAQCLSDVGNNDKALRQFKDILRLAAERSCSVLLSSEGFNDYDASKLKDFKNTLKKYGYELRCVYYVRSIAGYALSSYSQRVKRHQYSRTFSGYLRLSFSPPFSRIEHAVNAFGKDNIYLFNYDVHRSSLDKHFYEEILGILPDEKIQLNTKKVNRSLSAPELQFLRLMNRTFSQDNESRFVSDSLIYAEPDVDTKPRLATNDLQYIQENYQESVDYINSLNPDFPIELIDESIHLCEKVDSMEYNHFQKSLLAVLSSLVKSNLKKNG